MPERKVWHSPRPRTDLQERLLVTAANDTVLLWNAAAEALYGIRREHAIGQRFRDLDISYRAEGLRARIEDVRRGATTARLDDVGFTGRDGRAARADVTIHALFDPTRRDILVSAADVTAQLRLGDAFLRVTEQHQRLTEELQSANEELETTNEELQSTNTELLTTAEELQAANTLLGVRTDEV